MKKIIRTIMIVSVALSMLLFAISCDNRTPETPVIPFDPSLPTLPTPDLSMEFYNGSTSTDSSDWSLWDFDIENVADFPEGTSFMAEWESGNRHGTVDIDEVPMLLRTDYFKKGDFTIKVRVIAQCEGWNYSDATVVAER